MKKPVEPTELLQHLATLFPDSSKTTLRQMLQIGRVKVNGAPEKNAKRMLRPGDRVEVVSKADAATLDPRLTLLYEDDDLLVVIKAAGLLTVPSPGEKEETAQAFIDEYLQQKRGQRAKVHVVHRIDRDTSGVLVFAKNFQTREGLKEQFAEHAIDRVYIAMIEGSLPQASGTFRSHLDEDSRLRVKSTNNPTKGKEAVTHYKTLSKGKRYSILEVTLETGRRNQIRVHLAEAGHPIVGDTMYGSGRKGPLGRLGLHAHVLGFAHPKLRKRLRFEAPLPAEFKNVEL